MIILAYKHLRFKKRVYKTGIQIFVIQFIFTYIFEDLQNTMEHMSQISFAQRLGLYSEQRGKNETSTNQTSKALEYDSILGGDSQDQVSTLSSYKIKQIQKKIGLIENCQSQLQSKFQKVIDSLMKQISKKDEGNLSLEREVSELKNHLQQSKKDLATIVKYLSKKKMRPSQNENRRILLNTNKGSVNIQKSLSNSKGTINLSMKQIKQERKNRSPRMQLLKKSFKM